MQSSVASTLAGGQASSAPVLEFICLFTHDLKRKQKRWQDGRLKYHSFNKRIMVYDERGNFIGDTHWREDYEFGEGEEFNLERGGICVQTSECVGSRDQDLSELIDKRVQEKVQRQSTAASRQSRLRATLGGGMAVVPQVATPNSQMRHATIHSLALPTGHHGRALVPTESPFEQRQRKNAEQLPDQQESPHPNKRRRREPSPPSKSGYAQSLFGATLTLSGRPMSSAPVRHRPTSSQVYRQEQRLSASPDRSIHDTDRDEQHGVLQAIQTRPQYGTPLSEREPTAVNAPKPQIDSLVGKDARSKANVPSLLRQSKPQLSMVTDEPRKLPAAQYGNTNRSIDSEDEVEITPAEGRPAKLARPSKPTPDSSIQDHPRPKAKATKEMPSARHEVTMDPGDSTIAQPKGIIRETKYNKTDNASLQRSTSRVKSPVPQQSSKAQGEHTEGIGAGAGEEAGTEKPIVREPRIELRSAPRKRRGLLMLSERSSKKFSQSGKPTSFGSSQSIASDLNGSRSVIDDCTSRSGLVIPSSPKVPHDEHADQQLSYKDVSLLVEDDPFTKTTTSSCTERARDFSSSAKGPGCIAANRSIKQTAVSVVDEEIVSDKRATSVSSAVAPEPEKSSGEDHLTTAPKIVNKKRPRKENPNNDSGKRHSKSARFESEVVGDEVLQVIHSRKQMPDSCQHRGDYHVGRRREDEKSPSDIFSRQPENVPPPRLAQLSRKSVRSREVIGLVFEDEDDEPSFQVNHKAPVVQQVTSKTQEKPSAARNLSSLHQELEPSTLIADQNATAGSVTDGQEDQFCNNGQRGDSLIGVRKPIKPAQEISDVESLSTKSRRPNQQDRRTPYTPNNSLVARPGPLGGNRANSAAPGTTDSPLAEAAMAGATNDFPLASESCPGSMVQGNTIALHDTKYLPTEVVLTANKPSRISEKCQEHPVRDDNTKSQSFHGLTTSVNHKTILRVPSGSEAVETSRSVATKSYRSHSETLTSSHMLEDNMQGETTSTTVTARKPVPRLVNPATRGKKAAKPSDAAGQIPECVLPTAGQAPAVPAVIKPTNKQSNVLPGFSKANGGPWSREAHDLFEYKRPN